MSPPQIPKNNPYKLAYLWGFFMALGTIALSIKSVVSTPLSVDSYTHIAVGQYIVNHRTIPQHNDLSFKQTDPSLEWISHSWLSDVILYIAHTPHLLFGSLTLLLPLLFLSVYLTALLLPTETKNKFGYLLLSLPILCSLSFWRYHPFIFIVPLHLILVNVLRSWHQQPKRLFAIPFLFLLWANISGGTVVLPLLYLLVSILLELLLYRSDQTKKQPMTLPILVMIVPLSFIASLINPYRIRLYAYSLTTFAVVLQNKSFSSLIGALNTINQTYNKQQISSVYLMVFTLYVALLIILCISLVLKKPHVRTSIIRHIPALFLLPFAFFWVRCIPLVAFATLPLFAWCSMETIKNMSTKTKLRISYVVFPFFLIAILSLFINPPILAAPKLPTDHIARIREFSLPANLLTTYDLTGYILYSLPEYKVMLDAQDDLLNDESLISFYQPTGNFSQSFNTVSDKLSVQTALVSRDIGSLSSSLSVSDTWNLIYIDYDASLFVRKGSMEDSFFEKNAIHSLRLDKNLGFDPSLSATASAELASLLTRYPKNTLLSGQLATIYRIDKQFDNAEHLFQSIPSNRWNFSLYTEYGRLNAAQGKCIAAEDNFLKALSYRNEKNYSRVVLDLAVLYAGCFKDTTRAKHFFTRYNSFLITTAEREKLHMLTKQFGINMSQ